MATLNVKNFPDRLYRKLQRRAEKNRRSVAQEIIQLVDDAVADTPRRSLLELQGLGKELWQKALDGRDASEFIDDERDAWS
ncbi:MAG TPA: Arc family DNA-binding protein [Thermoanaerobaculia bacterium]|nr:Arc family DNA-binding protein [Thermoanaerobaculia bacterium]